MGKTLIKYGYLHLVGYQKSDIVRVNLVKRTGNRTTFYFDPLAPYSHLHTMRKMNITRRERSFDHKNTFSALSNNVYLKRKDCQAAKRKHDLRILMRKVSSLSFNIKRDGNELKKVSAKIFKALKHLEA